MTPTNTAALTTIDSHIATFTRRCLDRRRFRGFRRIQHRRASSL
jgi:hypothetical protein